MQPDTVASLIFTSGTTGKPKGVMLTHRNFTFMVSELARVFDFGVTDGMLSVLPLHHTFEFSAGLLMPLARGAQITYLGELTGEAINNALKKGHVTAIVGVPALWELLKRRVMQKLTDRSPLLEPLVNALAAGNYQLREKTGIDMGMLLFFPVHAGFGGRIRYLISGGSALPADVMKTFQGMGFNFYEGYGLTETAPVLTVTPPDSQPIPGSVGKPLPGVEVKIDSPDALGRGRGDRPRPQPDARLLAERGRHRRGGEGRLVPHRRSRPVRRGRQPVHRRPVEGRHHRLQREERVPRRGRGPVQGVPVHQGDLRGRPARRHRRAHRLRGDPQPGARPALGRAEVQAKIEQHFQTVSAGLPFWKRVKTLEFWEGELPKTAKRSIKRREVVAELVRRQQKTEAAGGRRGRDRPRRARGRPAPAGSSTSWPR